MKRTFAVALSSLTASTVALGGSLVVGAGEAQAVPVVRGLGWSAIIQHETGPLDNKGTLRMVWPHGGTITIGRVSTGAVIGDVSLDGQHVITARYDGTQTIFALWTTGTKSLKTLKLPGDWEAAYTADGGLITWNNYRGLMYKRNASGVAQARYAFPSGYAAIAWVNPEGTKYVVQTASGLTVHSTATGAALNRIPQAGANCRPESQLNASTLILSCYENGASRAYSVPYAGGVVKPLSPKNFFNYVPTTPAIASLPAGAGDGALNKVTATGSTLFREKPSGKVVEGMTAGGYDRYLWVNAKTNSDGRPVTLRKYDTMTGSYWTLAGAWRGGIVTDARTIDTHR
ncbi:hypothetical protein IEE94_13775 [Yimella sp. cx-573]|nr:hypothetical protein [Yimella sp. cx-573]